jgi:DNA-binding response OmpR family regulator
VTTTRETRALVVEDDADIGNLLVHALRKGGIAATLIANGADVMPALKRERPDVVLLDLMLPGVDGLQVCRSVRSDPDVALTPIIMVTAKSEEADRIAGLELGADDYITKPFSPNELVARVKAVLRRAHRDGPHEQKLVYGPLTIDVERHIVRASGHAVRLTAKEFLLLQYMMQHRGRVLSRDLLLSDVWGYTYTGGTRTVDVHVRRLREKLPALEEAIETVKQFGYKLVDPPPM